MSVRPPNRMTRAELRPLLRAARASCRRDYMLLLVTAAAGLRVSEAVTLRASSLLRAKGPHGVRYLRVVTLKQRRRKEDDVVIDGRTARELERWIGQLVQGPEGRSNPYVFAGGVDGHLSRRQAGRIFKAAARAAGLEPHVSIHALRHLRGAELWRVSGDAELVRSQLRHASVANTERYLSVDPERIAAVVTAAAGG